MHTHAKRFAVATLALTLSGLMSLPARAADVVDVAAEAGSFETLIAAANAADLVPALKGDGPITVFAPTDAAFDKLPDGTVASLLEPENKDRLQTILKFHVVPGHVDSSSVTRLRALNTLAGQRLDVAFADGSITVSGARIATADIRADNGVIHVLDSVMMPETANIVETAQASDFTTLVKAVEAAGLVDALSSDGPFTVFAPTDEAFSKVDSGTLESLLKPENKAKLRAILQYHVVPGRVFASDAIAGGSAQTLQGQSVTISYEDAQLRIDEAAITTPDLETSNGVIHVIDSVLMPATGKAEVEKMIQHAIAVGAPAYNAGNVHKCVRVYKRTLSKMADHEAVSDQMRKQIRRTMRAVDRQHAARDKAWTMRRMLDKAYAQMSETPDAS